MKNSRLILIAVVLVSAGLAVALVTRSKELTFRGKAESFWITNIVYYGPADQAEQWRGFGPEGVHLLTRALDRGNGFTRTYRRLHRRHSHNLPGFLGRLLPQPADTQVTRMKVLSMLLSLSVRDTNFARLAEPAVARAMRDDDASVRGFAVGWYEAVLRDMTAKEKRVRLPDFLRLVQDPDHWVRNNAAVALSFCREEAASVAPVLVKVLPEPNPAIQITIAQALVRVDREAAARTGVASIATNILKNPDGQIACRAADVLGELRAEPPVSVPALIDGLGATNREVAIASFRALLKFKDQAEHTVPALRKAAERQDIPNWVKAGLGQIDPPADKR